MRHEYPRSESSPRSTSDEGNREDGIPFRHPSWQTTTEWESVCSQWAQHNDRQQPFESSVCDQHPEVKEETWPDRGASETDRKRERAVDILLGALTRLVPTLPMEVLVELAEALPTLLQDGRTARRAESLHLRVSERLMADFRSLVAAIGRKSNVATHSEGSGDSCGNVRLQQPEENAGRNTEIHEEVSEESCNTSPQPEITATCPRCRAQFPVDTPEFTTEIGDHPKPCQTTGTVEKPVGTEASPTSASISRPSPSPKSQEAPWRRTTTSSSGTSSRWWLGDPVRLSVGRSPLPLGSTGLTPPWTRPSKMDPSCGSSNEGVGLSQTGTPKSANCTQSSKEQPADAGNRTGNGRTRSLSMDEISDVSSDLGQCRSISDAEASNSCNQLDGSNSLEAQETKSEPELAPDPMLADAHLEAVAAPDITLATIPCSHARIRRACEHVGSSVEVTDVEVITDVSDDEDEDTLFVLPVGRSGTADAPVVVDCNMESEVDRLEDNDRRKEFATAQVENNNQAARDEPGVTAAESPRPKKKRQRTLGSPLMRQPVKRKTKESRILSRNTTGHLREKGSRRSRRGRRPRCAHLKTEEIKECPVCKEMLQPFYAAAQENESLVLGWRFLEERLSIPQFLRVEIKCKAGHKFTSCPENLSKGAWCPVCRDIPNLVYKSRSELRQEEEQRTKAAQERQARLINQARAKFVVYGYVLEGSKGSKVPFRSASEAFDDWKSREPAILSQARAEAAASNSKVTEEEAFLVLSILARQGENPWRILNIPAPANHQLSHDSPSFANARLVYRALIKKIHPDKNPHPRASAAFQQVNLAWKMICIIFGHDPVRT